MPALPLFVHQRPESIVAYRDGEPIDARRFLCDARALAARLPAGMHVLNLCTDRYRFTVGLAASLLSGKCSLLPPAHTPELIRQLRSFAPDGFCLTDDADCTLDLPLLFYRDGEADGPPSQSGDWSVPQIDAAQLAAYIFTSGSTGAPVSHRKTWGRLVQCVRLEATRLRPIDRGGCAILGTVPPQHMYGFESTVLLPLHSGGALCAGRSARFGAHQHAHPGDLAGHWSTGRQGSGEDPLKPVPGGRRGATDQTGKRYQDRKSVV